MTKKRPRADHTSQPESILLGAESGQWSNMSAAVLESCIATFWREVASQMPIVGLLILSFCITQGELRSVTDWLTIRYMNQPSQLRDASLSSCSPFSLLVRAHSSEHIHRALFRITEPSPTSLLSTYAGRSSFTMTPSPPSICGSRSHCYSWSITRRCTPLASCMRGLTYTIHPLSLSSDEAAQWSDARKARHHPLGHLHGSQAQHLAPAISIRT